MKICKNQKPQKFTSKDSKAQKSIRKRRIRLSMCRRNSGLPNRPRPSLLAEGNLELEDDVEIEEGDNGRTNIRTVVYEWRIYLSTS